MVKKWTSAEQEQGFRTLCEKFQCDEFQLFLLFATNTNFRDICEDYGAALYAVQAWAAKPEVAHQFHCIAVEFEMEVGEMLGSSSIADDQSFGDWEISHTEPGTSD